MNYIQSKLPSMNTSYLFSWLRDSLLLQNPVFIYEFLAFMEPEVSLQCRKAPATVTYPYSV